jgi:phage terminase large subunit-like protein
VCTTWGVKGKHLFLFGLFRRRLEYPALKRAVREQQSLFGANEVLIEDKASGTADPGADHRRLLRRHALPADM